MFLNLTPGEAQQNEFCRVHSAPLLLAYSVLLQKREERDEVLSKLLRGAEAGSRARPRHFNTTEMALALKRQRVPASRGLEATQLSKVAKIWAKTPYLIWDNFNAFFHFEKNWQFFLVKLTQSKQMLLETVVV